MTNIFDNGRIQLYGNDLYNHCLYCTIMSLRHWIWQIKKGVV